jgi:homoserine dehydrogenase
VRTSSFPAAVYDAFGHVNYVDADIEGETAFTTEVMTEGEFEEKAAKIELINRIRLG